MNQVSLNNVQLDYLAYKHPTLGPLFGGMRSCDRLPNKLDFQGRRAYIVNTDPHDRPGTHWLALWTDGEDCELFDSFALPLKTYLGIQPLIDWIERHYTMCVANSDSVQAVTSQTCG